MLWLKKLYWKFVTYRRQRVKESWQRAHNPSQHSIPVFLGGCYRSGTTITARSLAKSREIDFYSDGDSSAFNQWYLRDFYTVYSLIQESYARVVLFQPNNEFLRLHHLLEQYPAARAIIVFRHFQDVVNSTLRNEWRFVKGQIIYNLALLKHLFTQSVYQEALEPITETLETHPTLQPGEWAHSMNLKTVFQDRQTEALYYAVYWLICARFVEEQGLYANDRVMLVNYENFVAAPVQYLAKVCSFLDIQFQDDLAEDIHAQSVGKYTHVLLPKNTANLCAQAYKKLYQREQQQFG